MIKSFFNIMTLWRVCDKDAQALLGDISNDVFNAMKNDPGMDIDDNVLLRISYIVSIFKALNFLYSKELADSWVQLPNSNKIFGGETALAYMIKGGVPALNTVDKLLYWRIS